jgi:hypothetical protein
MNNIWEGITIGGAGGAIAGLTLWIIKSIEKKILELAHRNRIYKWLEKNTTEDEAFRSTRAIASWCNLTEERVRYICSIDKRIFLSTGDKEDLWSLYEREARSVYEKRGIISV